MTEHESGAPLPKRLNSGGKTLWREVVAAHDLDATQLVQLEEACRAKDRLDRLDRILSGDLDTWLSIKDYEDGRPSELVINGALAQANATATLMMRLLAATRLPDPKTGKKPQLRSARGAYSPTPAVSSLDRARSRSTG